MKYIGKEERIFPQFGMYKPGVIVEYNQTLFDTGLFEKVKKGDK